MTGKKQKILEEISLIDLSPEVSAKLFPHQIAHTKNLLYSLRQNSIALEWSDTGAGKSYTSSAVAKQEGLKLFVIGPKSSIAQWYQIADEWEIECLGVVNYETIKNGKYYSSRNIDRRINCPYIQVIKEVQENALGQPLLSKQGKEKQKIGKVIWDIPPNTLVVIDEAHKGKNGISSTKQSNNSIFISSLRSCFNKEKRVYGLVLSATITDRIECLDSVLYLLGFYRPYMADAYLRFLRSLGYQKDESSEQVFRKLNNILFPKYGSRMKIDSGDKKNIIIAKSYTVDMDVAKKIEEEHRKMHTLSSQNGEIKIVHMSRSWQIIERCKIPTCLKLAEENLEQYSLVIFVNFLETMNLLSETLSKKYRVGVLHGKQSTTEREEIRLAFQKDELDCLICQIKTGGVCISLHALTPENRPRMSIIFPTWDAIAFRQALGRIHRAGSCHDALQIILYCISEEQDYSIERTICDNINKKISNIDLINDNDLRGSLRI